MSCLLFFGLMRNAGFALVQDEFLFSHFLPLPCFLNSLCLAFCSGLVLYGFITLGCKLGLLPNSHVARLTTLASSAGAVGCGYWVACAPPLFCYSLIIFCRFFISSMPSSGDPICKPRYWKARVGQLSNARSGPPHCLASQKEKLELTSSNCY